MKFRWARRLLELPTVYKLQQQWVGSDRIRRVYVADHLRASPGDVVMDIGCGTAEILDHLPPVHYLGLDANPAYIEAASARFRARGSFRVLSVADMRLPEFAGKADLVIGIGILHHLDDREADTCCAVAMSLLKPRGRFVTVDGVFHPGQGVVRRVVLSVDRGRHVRTREAYLALVRPHFSTVRDRIYDDLTRLPSSFLVMECTK